MLLRRVATSLIVACLLSPQQSCPRTGDPSPQRRLVHERLRGVLSRAKLSPNLRADASISYSPDGQYLFVQDPAGVMLFARNPLRLVTYVDAPHSYPARFSADSKLLSILAYDLFLSRWQVQDGKQIETPNLIIPGGCLSAALSPGGDLLACDTPDMQVAVYRIADAKRLFFSSLRDVSAPFGAIPIPFDSTTDYSAPFGYFLSSSFRQLANRGLFYVPAWFSPDEAFLISGDDTNSMRVNLATFSKENFASPLRKKMYAIAGLAPNDRALVLDRAKSAGPSLVSFSTGQPIRSFPDAADSARLCTNSRFALFRRDLEATLRLADLDSEKVVSIPDGLAADVYASEIAVLKRNGTVLFFKFGETQPVEGVRLPLGSLPPLRAAGVNGDLTTLALAVQGIGGVFDVATGKQLREEKMFLGAQLSDPKHPLLLAPRKFKTPYQVLREDMETRSASLAWSGQMEAQIIPGASSFLEYSLYSEMGRMMVVVSDLSGVAFALRGLDPASGAPRWTMKFGEEIPTPFSDPQGSRFVLGWKAKSDRARNALKNAPAALDAYKHSKRMEQDSVFEAFDATTGKPVGAAFVQFGDGPITFSSAFAIGDVLFLIKDNTRVTVISLRDGKIVAHAKGFQPEANAQSNLFVLDEGYGRLSVFDLVTGTRLEQQQFADAIAYKRFSADGKRLLVLTQHQDMFVLDMSTVREHPLPPPSEAHEDEEKDFSDSTVDQPQ